MNMFNTVIVYAIAIFFLIGIFGRVFLKGKLGFVSEIEAGVGQVAGLIFSFYHRFEDGYKIGDIPLEKLINLRTFVVHVDPAKGYFDGEDFQVYKDEDLAGAAVLCESGHDRKFMTPEYEKNVPYITLEGAKWLMERKVAVVGIDSQLVDNYNKKSDPDYAGDVVHDEIFSHLSVICEDMIDLNKLPDRGARLYVVPIRVAMASFPARVFAIVDEE